MNPTFVPLGAVSPIGASLHVGSNLRNFVAGLGPSMSQSSAISVH